jgi:hypothetical protein
MAVDLSFWREVRETCELIKARLTTGGGQPVAKSNGHNGHRPALGRALATGAARRQGWR